jgi:hypothetical protein
MESIPTEGFALSKYVTPATRRDAIENASQLTAEDCRELEDAGWDPYLALVYSVDKTDSPVKYITPSGRVAAFGGVVDEGSGVGRIWLLCTDAVRENPMSFYRAAKAQLASIRGYTLLHNVADPRNKMHMKLLHKLGFKRLSYVEVGPKNHTYVEFAKLCAPPLQSASQLP